MKCLLVDDEAGIREGLAALLRLKGHEVHPAGDVAAALALLAEQDFELVITDWRLPDGTAAAVLAAASCPVVAISGHPAEVDRTPNLRTVLAKPVAPAELLALLAAAAPPAPAPAELPLDVQDLVAAAEALLGSRPQLQDDGTFLRLRAPLPGAGVPPALRALGGDLRVLAGPGTGKVVELRCYRDGRPADPMPVLAPDDPWPAEGELAVDFAGSALDPERFLLLLDQAAAAAAAGRRLQFLNVPGALRFLAEVSGRGHDLPMRTKPGPRLAAVQAELWG